MTEMSERRLSTRLRRTWWTVSNPGRLARFNRARKRERTVTSGFLWFRDAIVLGFVTVIVIAGVSIVRDLRADDCRSTNARRADIADISKKLVDNDRNLIEFIDNFIPEGLPFNFKEPLLTRYQAQVVEIEEAFRLRDCPGRDLP